MSETNPVSTFQDMELPDPLLRALNDIGYESPTPIQAQTIPLLLTGKDLLGHAPTGTGKTAAFALPLLARLDLKKQGVQLMVLAPTRELAIQVAEAFQTYAKHLKGFHVLPIYGGQDYTGQTRQLKRGAQVVVGTPGRVMDHMRRGTLKLDSLQALVLDEGDEMLRMGFIDDIKWILEQTPPKRQLALFSATMPKEIQRIARQHLQDPAEVTIKTKTATADTIRQRYWTVSGHNKLDALTRILEAEPFDAVLIFVRTRLATAELSEKLEARGHTSAALNGDMQQKQREKIVERLKRGSLEIVVATDVAARGLDVERISHVINYDIPYDTEAYIHRIGRTGRAGRTGEAILFVTPREKRMLYAIEKATRQKIEPLTLPTTEMVNNRRIAAFHQSITDTLATGQHEFMQNLLMQYQQEHNIPAIDMAAALATMYMGDKDLLIKPEKQKRDKDRKSDKPVKSERAAKFDKPVKSDIKQPKQASTVSKVKTKNIGAKPIVAEPTKEAPTVNARTETDIPRDDSVQQKQPKPAPRKQEIVTTDGLAPPEKGMEWYRFEAGKEHDVKPATIIVTIANEAGLDAEYIGRMEIEPKYTLIELPEGMPKLILQDLKKAHICGEKMKMSRLEKPQKSSSKGGKTKPAKSTGKGKGSVSGKGRPGPKANKGSKPKQIGASRKKNFNKENA